MSFCFLTILLCCLRTFAFHLSLAGLFILLRGDPHLLECANAGQYGAANPGAKTSFHAAIGRNHFQSCIRGSTQLQISVETFGKTLQQCVAT